MPSKHLLKRSQVLLDASDFDPAIMRGIDMQCHVLHIDNARACTLDKASWATVQILRQAEAAHSKWTQSDGSNGWGALWTSRHDKIIASCTFFGDRERLGGSLLRDPPLLPPLLACDHFSEAQAWLPRRLSRGIFLPIYYNKNLASITVSATCGPSA